VHVGYVLNLRRNQALLFWERSPLSLNMWACFAYCCELCGEESTSFTQLSSAQWLLYLSPRLSKVLRSAHTVRLLCPLYIHLRANSDNFHIQCSLAEFKN
jgi:hypothetical protein